jgi:hypothetical protein
MSTKRERQQLAKRLGKGRRHPAQPAKQGSQSKQQPESESEPQPPDQDPEDPHIGYFACEGRDLLRHDDGAIVIVGSRAAMQQTLQRRGRTGMTICDVRSCEIMLWLVEGAAFCFDDQAYARFLKPARQAGLPLKDNQPVATDPPGTPAIGLRLDYV